MTVRWKIYDLGRERVSLQPRFFIGGVDDCYSHWTPEHRYTLDVAKQIKRWKNEREYARRRALRASGRYVA